MDRRRTAAAGPSRDPPLPPRAGAGAPADCGMRRGLAVRPAEHPLCHRHHQHVGVDHAQLGALRLGVHRRPGGAVRVLKGRVPRHAFRGGGRDPPCAVPRVLLRRVSGAGASEPLGGRDRRVGVRARPGRLAPCGGPPGHGRGAGSGGLLPGAHRRRPAHGGGPGGQVTRGDLRHALRGARLRDGRGRDAGRLRARYHRDGALGGPAHRQPGSPRRVARDTAAGVGAAHQPVVPGGEQPPRSGRRAHGLRHRHGGRLRGLR